MPDLRTVVQRLPWPHWSNRALCTRVQPTAAPTNVQITSYEVFQVPSVRCDVREHEYMTNSRRFRLAAMKVRIVAAKLQLVLAGRIEDAVHLDVSTFVLVGERALTVR